jgi:hypothetical protein
MGLVDLHNLVAQSFCLRAIPEQGSSIEKNEIVRTWWDRFQHDGGG